MILKLLNSVESNRLFLQESILLSCADVVTESRIADLFGKSIMEHIHMNTANGHFIGGEDWNVIDNIKYFTRAGFLKIVSMNNLLLIRANAEIEAERRKPSNIVSFNDRQRASAVL